MRYILTAEGGRAGRHRIAVGKQGAAGRLITGIEYALGSRYLGERGVAPDLRPARGKGGPGAVLTLPLPVVAALMGESDPIADKPTWRRVDRAIAEPRTWALGSGGTGAFTPDSERPLRPCNHRAN